MSDAALSLAPSDDPAAELPAGLADRVDAISNTLDEPAWLRDWRQQALRRAEETPWPSLKEETWRRTPAERLPRRAVVSPPMPANGVVPEHIFAPHARAGLLYHVGGHGVDAELRPDLAEAGVLLAPLSQAAREHPQLVQRWLGSTHAPSFDRYGALGAALWTQGMFCYIPPGVQVDHSIFHLTSQPGDGADLWAYTLIAADRESAVSVIEAGAGPAGDLRDDGVAPFVHHTVELASEAAANVQFAMVQRWSHDTAALTTAVAEVGRDARLRYNSVSIGADLDKQRIDLELDQPGGHADLHGVFAGRGRQHIEHITRQHHNGVNASSELLVRGVLTDESHAVQYGVIRIDPEGQKTSAFQTMRNLLLDEGAGADPIPVLEIEADDVKCSHAAAVGPVSAEQLFYLQSRGIPPEIAERMVVRGFLAEIVDGIADEHLREVLDVLIEEQLQIPHTVVSE